MSDELAPKHAFEVRVVIGGTTWESVRRDIERAAEHIRERDPEHCGCASGHWDGCFSVDVARRDVTPEQYREELEQWRQRMVEQRQVEEKQRTAASGNFTLGG